MKGNISRIPITGRVDFNISNNRIYSLLRVVGLSIFGLTQTYSINQPYLTKDGGLAVWHNLNDLREGRVNSCEEEGTTKEVYKLHGAQGHVIIQDKKTQTLSLVFGGDECGNNGQTILKGSFQ